MGHPVNARKVHRRMLNKVHYWGGLRILFMGGGRPSWRGTRVKWGGGGFPHPPLTLGNPVRSNIRILYCLTKCGVAFIIRCDKKRQEVSSMAN